MTPLTGHEIGSGYTAGTSGLIRAVNTVGQSVATLRGVNTAPVGTTKLSSCTADRSYKPSSMLVD